MRWIEMEKITEKRFRLAKKNKGEGTERIKLLAAIVSGADAREIAEICNRESAALSYAVDGFGTARSAILDYLGLDEKEKHVVLALIPESAESAILAGVQKEMSLYLVGKGICFTMPLTGVSSIVANGLLKGAVKEDKENQNGRIRKMNEERTHELIVVAVQNGYASEAMEAARRAGAGGGTLVHAATLNNRKAEQLIGVTLQTETEILMILTKKEGRDEIMQAIRDTAGLKTDAGGVLFSMPVDNLVGVGGAN